MDRLSQYVFQEIMIQYGNLSRFSTVTGISYSTLAACFEKGLGRSGYGLVSKMLKHLRINQYFAGQLLLTGPRLADFGRNLNNLDAIALNHIRTALEHEYNRCIKDGVKSTNGVFVIQEELT